MFSSIFYVCISIIIQLIGVFIFVADPYLTKTVIWPAITADLDSVFKGLLAISLLAMAMSTADSNLNACSVLVTHDMVGVLNNNKINNSLQLQLTKIISFVVAILAMALTFYQKDLLELLLLGNRLWVPIVNAPLFLAIFGFRSSSRIALIGMATGIITILLWHKYLPGIEGAFPAMLANGIAMLIAHYSLPRKPHGGWEKTS